MPGPGNEPEAALMTAFIPAVLTAGLLSWPVAGHEDTAQLIEQAYAYNRAGMIAMSKAEFDDAIEQFQKAAELVPDYGITRRGLRYTPNFMIGWAHEKTGRDVDACRSFRRFLDLAPHQWMEEEKADHARQYLGRHCPELQRQALPEHSYGL